MFIAFLPLRLVTVIPLILIEYLADVIQSIAEHSSSHAHRARVFCMSCFQYYSEQELAEFIEKHNARDREKLVSALRGNEVC